MLCTIWFQDWPSGSLICRIWRWNMAGGRAPSSPSWGRRSKSWTLSSTCTWWPGYRPWLDLLSRCRWGGTCACLFPFASILRCFACNRCGLLSNRSTGIQNLRLLSRSGSKKEKPWGKGDHYSSLSWLSHRTSSWWCECVSLAGLRRRTSSTVSLGVSSGRTTTPPTSPAVSRALPTSTWPPSAVCSTTTSSTPSSPAAPPCSTSPLSGLNTVPLTVASLYSTTGTMQNRVKTADSSLTPIFCHSFKEMHATC